MVTLHKGGAFLLTDDNRDVKRVTSAAEAGMSEEDARKGTLTYKILSGHNKSGNDKELKITFDALASHDITYVGIIQTARATGKLERFPVPYVLTNCHNSLCAVGGTINEDDHMFGLSAAKRYGGIYVPAHEAVIHAYMREMMAGAGKMILGSDSHTRYGAIGTMGFGEGGPELVKQLLGLTYDISYPKVIAVNLTGIPKPGVGPHDVAIALIGAVYDCGFVKNCVLEFVGSGIVPLSMEFRNGIDVMTTETACLSSIWRTDGITESYLANRGRHGDFERIAPERTAYYDGVIDIELDKIEPMIALPYHPSRAVPLRTFIDSPADVLHEYGLDELCSKIDADGKFHVDQGVIAGCAGGTYSNICAAADILNGKSTGNGEFSLSVYPASQPILTAMMETGVAATLVKAGVSMRTAFCGPCFGAGDVPCNGGFSIRHTTRNFPNREGSKPSNGQSACVALMDARSIAATAANGGILTSAADGNYTYRGHEYMFDGSAYRSRVYNGFGKPDPTAELRFGPGIADWPKIEALGDDLVLSVVSVIDDPVTTTDELIPSGETSSFRSNPMKLAEFALSRRDPDYVARAKAAVGVLPDHVKAITGDGVQIASTIFAVKPGDGSAREQAASCQRVLGGGANIANDYATKRYRSNLINWGMLPLLTDLSPEDFRVGDYVYLPGIRAAVEAGKLEFDAKIIHADGSADDTVMKMAPITEDERRLILSGCLINYCRRD